jgi:hypothetical protein
MVAFIGVCPVRGLLISGALAIQLESAARSAGTARLVVFGSWGGSGMAGAGGRVWLGTLLGPEETGRFRGRRLRVVASFPPRAWGFAGLPLLSM